jgi:type I restriction enzyme M protein
MCSEAYRVQMRGFATGSDGLAEIVEADCLEVVLPKIKTDEARRSAEKHLALYAEGHATLRSYVTEMERAGSENIPYVPDRKTVFVQV